MTKQHAAAATAPPPLADDGPNVDLSADQNAFAALARGFVEAFNDRDAEGLVALAHARIVFRPTTLIGHRRTYNGHADPVLLAMLFLSVAPTREVGAPATVAIGPDLEMTGRSDLLHNHPHERGPFDAREQDPRQKGESSRNLGIG